MNVWRYSLECDGVQAVTIRNHALAYWQSVRAGGAISVRRLKNRFDKEGIEIPFPHRTVYLEKSD